MRQISAKQVLEAAKASIKSAEYCFLITLSASGEAQARLVQPFEPEQDLTIWFGTSPETRKVSEIQLDSRATVAVHDAKETAYVTLLGSAQVERDINKKRKYWREEWAAFTPGGPEGDDYVLIKFAPSRIELMNFARGILPKPYGLRPAILVRSGDSWVVEV